MCPSAKNINEICLQSLVNVESVLASTAQEKKKNKRHTNKLLFLLFFLCMPAVL